MIQINGLWNHHRSLRLIFKKMPKLWDAIAYKPLIITLLISLNFGKNFLLFRNGDADDIMVSYAPKGGSVGQHFDFYDVSFCYKAMDIVVGNLGKCVMLKLNLLRQPLKLLPEMQVNFDEVLAPGDLLYVPPGLAHYGVAEDDCLTFSVRFPHAEY